MKLMIPTRFEGDRTLCPKTFATQRGVPSHLRAIRHEQQVAAIAANLFDLTHPLHRLSLADRRLLRLGTIVHVVGRCVSKREHPAEGARMVLEDRTLPILSSERRALAYFTLYHRGPVPPVGKDAILGDGDDHDGMLKLLAILRVADSLDNRSLDQPASVMFALFAATRARRELRVTCYVAEDSPKARKVYRKRKKFRLLEELLGVDVEVERRAAEAVRLVA
jgi:exopolyphosphatase/pppGpp-phosphohydrolase